jgi:hypothetical protein
MIRESALAVRRTSISDLLDLTGDLALKRSTGH